MAQLGHDLADAIDQNVFVIYRSQPFDTWRHLKPVITVHVALYGNLRLLGKSVKRMLHMLHHILENSIPNIADEQIMLRVPVW